MKPDMPLFTVTDIERWLRCLPHLQEYNRKADLPDAKVSDLANRYAAWFGALEVKCAELACEIRQLETDVADLKKELEEVANDTLS
jgi:hypothetical protein